MCRPQKRPVKNALGNSFQNRAASGILFKAISIVQGPLMPVRQGKRPAFVIVIVKKEKQIAGLIINVF